MKNKTYLPIIFAFLFNFCFLSFAMAQGLPLARPESVGMSRVKLNQISDLVNKDIADKKLPGAVVIVGRKGKIVYRKAFGNRALVPQVEKMTIDTIFDVASLTKVVATSTSIMVLLERGEIRLNDTIGKFIPEIEDKDAKAVTIQQLLTHISGYQPDFDLREKWLGRGGMLNALYKEKLRSPPGTRFVYSDIGFIVLAEIIQRVTKEGVAEFADGNVFAPLRMNTSGYGRVENSSNVQNVENSNIVQLSRIAPTENIRGQQNYLGSKFEGTEAQGSRILRGQVHDPTAYRMNGEAGHAGLFSTADDLARYCQMILNGGILDGQRILSPSTVALMTRPNVVADDGSTRGLGFDMNTSFSQNRGEFFPVGSFGHTGFTGTGIWIDPSSETFYVFLSNRVHPDGKGDVTPLRAKVATVVASAINDSNSAKLREAEQNYYASVMPQIEKFKIWVQSQRAKTEGQRASINAVVLNGIDVLEKNNFKELNGLRVGLVTNHTGRNRIGKQTIDILKEAKNVQLVSLFSPEHGIRGQLDQDKISDSIDEKTSLPIYSLYGETRRPKPEQLQNLDVLVFDIQDIGTRFYTYISTLRNVMEEAAKAKIKVIVLDRPNPINGIDVEGGLADEDKLNFIAAHTIPVRHGMTVGEMAQMMNAERKIGADLSVIKLDNWNRAMWFDETNQTWVNPSPNMRSLTQATLYPGIGLMEFTNISVGRGTDTPFEIIGAPWIDGQKLALYLNQKNLPGVRFIPNRFKPNASVHKDQECGGINIVITERERFKPIRVGLEIAGALRTIFPNDWKIENYSRLWLNAEVFESFKQGKSVEDIEKNWIEKLNAFKTRRALYLLYK